MEKRMKVTIIELLKEEAKEIVLNTAALNLRAKAIAPPYTATEQFHNTDETTGETTWRSLHFLDSCHIQRLLISCGGILIATLLWDLTLLCDPQVFAKVIGSRICG